MTNKPAKITSMDLRNIPPGIYLRTLIRKAEESGWDVSGFRLGVLQLTQKLAKRMSFGASGSMRIESAQELLESIFYCIGHILKNMGEREAIEAIGEGDTERLWVQGKKAIEEEFKEAEKLLESLQSNMLRTRNIAYNSTLGEGLGLFFKSYDIDYAAHESPGSIDYQLALTIPPITGIEYICEYLRRLNIENEFCIKYAGEIDSLLLSLSQTPEDLMVNIYETALINAAGRVLCGLGGESLDITDGDRERLYKTLSGMTKDSLAATLSAAADRACGDAGILDPAAKSYARGWARTACAHVLSALENRSLEAIFVSLRKAERKPRFKDAVSMDDETFREVTEEIRSCRFVSDKTALLKRSVKSIRDLSDMLGADCFDKDEYSAVFSSFDKETLALLYKTLPESGQTSEWQKEFKTYLKLNGVEDKIRRAAEEIEIE